MALMLLSPDFNVSVVGLVVEYLLAECWFAPVISVLQVSGWGLYCCDFMLLPIAPYCSLLLLGLALVSRRSTVYTRSSKLPPPPAVSFCLPLSTTHLSLLPNHHPQSALPYRVRGHGIGIFTFTTALSGSTAVYVVGYLMDKWTLETEGGPRNLRLLLLGTMSIVYVLCAILFYCASRILVRPIPYLAAAAVEKQPLFSQVRPHMTARTTGPQRMPHVYTKGQPQPRRAATHAAPCPVQPRKPA